jgi:hypothetical protein
MLKRRLFEGSVRLYLIENNALCYFYQRDSYIWHLSSSGLKYGVHIITEQAVTLFRETWYLVFETKKSTSMSTLAHRFSTPTKPVTES